METVLASDEDRMTKYSTLGSLDSLDPLYKAAFNASPNTSTVGDTRDGGPREDGPREDDVTLRRPF